MENDFSEVLNKFSDILKEKNIDLNNITGGNSIPPVENQDFSLDIETILKIKNIMSKINQNHDCPRNKLLQSLMPYLEKNKQDKLEQYIEVNAGFKKLRIQFDFNPMNIF